MPRMIVAGLVALVMLVAGSPGSSAAEDVRVDGGSWTKKGYAAAGGWTLVEREGERVVILDEGFKTRKAPDLKLFLSPLPLAKLTGDNATEGAMLVGKLSSNKGRQEFTLPKRVDLKRFKTVIIHCEQYSKLWSGAALAQPAAR